MHSGFMPLRNECSMNIHRKPFKRELSADAKANVARIQEIWTDCRSKYASDGPFLFGRFTGADAMYAPVIHRFRTYGVEVTGKAAEYVRAMQNQPAFVEWTEAGLKESWVIEKFEND
jgi:glutathione S-transferase